MKSNDKPRPCIKKQRHHFAGQGLSSQSYGFSSSHVQMWNLNHKEGWAPNNWCFQIVVLEKTLESSLDSKEIKPVNPKRNQPWIFIGRTGAKAPIFWPPNAESWLIEKDPNAGKDCGQEEKGTAEDEMVGWHYRLNGHEFEQTPGDSEGWESLACCSPWGHKEPDTTEWLNNSNPTERALDSIPDPLAIRRSERHYLAFQPLSCLIWSWRTVQRKSSFRFQLQVSSALISSSSWLANSSLWWRLSDASRKMNFIFV